MAEQSVASSENQMVVRLVQTWVGNWDEQRAARLDLPMAACSVWHSVVRSDACLVCLWVAYLVVSMAEQLAWMTAACLASHLVYHLVLMTVAQLAKMQAVHLVSSKAEHWV